MTIVDLLNNNYKSRPNDTALVEINPPAPDGESTKPYRRALSWEEFYRESNKIANLLLKSGLKKGDKAAILLHNSLEWLPIYFGILKAGIIAVPLNYRYTAEEIRYSIEKSDSTVLIFGDEFTKRTDEIRDFLTDNVKMYFVGENAPEYASSLIKETEKCSSSAPETEIVETDDAAIYFSSGTTGFPKAILHTHQSLIHAAITEQKHHGQTAEDVFLCIPPLYHTGAIMHWFGSLAVGGKAVLLCGTKPEKVLKAVSDEKCTIVWLLVPWAQDILDAVDSMAVDLNDYELGQWRLMHIGAQPVPPSLVKRWLKVFPNHQYDTNYGLSECTGPGCVHLGIENVDKVGAIGKAGYGWQIKIVDESFNPIKRGEVGELCIKGPAVMKGYYKDEAETKAAIRDGWLLTGDMVTEDEDGFLYLVDRKKDVIISGGENIYPVQIEDFLRKNDKIKDAAAIGFPDKRLGEITAAIIELKPGETMTEEEAELFCRELPRYKRPKVYIFAEVPRNPTGKIEKTVLRKKYCGATSIVPTE